MNASKGEGGRERMHVHVCMYGPYEPTWLRCLCAIGLNVVGCPKNVMWATSVEVVVVVL